MKHKPKKEISIESRVKAAEKEDKKQMRELKEFLKKRKAAQKSIDLKKFSTVVRYEITYVSHANTEPITRWGGKPNSWKGFPGWPVCTNCEMPMAFILQVNGEQIDLKGNYTLQAYGCLSGDCEMYHLVSSDEASSGMSRLFLSKEKMNMELLTPLVGTQVLKAQDMKIKKTTEPSLEARDNKDNEIAEKAFDVAICDKFYGIQATGNDSEDSICSTCKKNMVFLGQFTEGDIQGYEDWFISILKICPNGHSASFQGVRG